VTSNAKYQWKVLGILFGAFFLGYGAALSAGILLVFPLIGWAIHGVLYFPISPPELFRLALAVLGMTVVTTPLMWLEGKWNSRW